MCADTLSDILGNDATVLASMIRRLYEDEPCGIRLREKPARTDRQCSWECKGQEVAAIFEDTLCGKARPRRKR